VEVRGRGVVGVVVDREREEMGGGGCEGGGVGGWRRGGERGEEEGMGVE